MQTIEIVGVTRVDTRHLPTNAHRKDVHQIQRSPSSKATNHFHQASLQGSDCIPVLMSAFYLINFQNISNIKAREWEKSKKTKVKSTGYRQESHQTTNVCHELKHQLEKASLKWQKEDSQCKKALLNIPR